MDRSAILYKFVFILIPINNTREKMFARIYFSFFSSSFVGGVCLFDFCTDTFSLHKRMGGRLDR